MVKIRLQRRGRRKKPFYHIVIADARSPRDGRFIEKIGTYNPMTKPATIDLDSDAAFDWLLKGAQPTDTVRAILRVRGVMYRKHLHRGVIKGALTQEQADKMYREYVEKKEASFRDRAAETRKEKDEQRRKVAGVVPKIETPEPEPEAPADEAPAAEAPAAESSADETPATEAPVAVEAPDQQVPEASAPGDEPEAIREATSPAAVNAEAEADAAEPAVESAVDQAVDAAEAKEVVPEEKLNDAEEPAHVTEAKQEEAAAAPAAPAPTGEADKLTKIEGIGPKIASVLTEAGVGTFAALAAKTPEDLRAILDAAEGNFKTHNPGTWPDQAKLAADGKWDDLKTLQDQLDGGKVVA